MTNTRATAFPEAAIAAALRSLSLVEDETAAPSVLALVVIASSGYNLVRIKYTLIALSTYRNEVREVSSPTLSIHS